MRPQSGISIEPASPTITWRHRAAPVDQHADLPADLARELGQLTRQLVGDQALGRQAPLREALEPLQVTRLQAVGVAVDADGCAFWAEDPEAEDERRLPSGAEPRQSCPREHAQIPAGRNTRAAISAPTSSTTLPRPTAETGRAMSRSSIVPPRPPLAVVILAAGHGTRMKSRRAKVLHEIAGRPMLAYPLALAEALAPERLVVVIGRDADAVQDAFAERAQFVVQAEQKGTGHAVPGRAAGARGFEGEVLILYGDVPLLRAESVEALRALKAESKAPLAMLTSPGAAARPRGARRPTGASSASSRSPTPAPRSSRSARATPACTCSTPSCSRARSASSTPRTRRGSSTSPTSSRSRARGSSAVEALRLEDAGEALGVNNRAELARATAVQHRRNVDRLMAQGVTFIDPAAVWIDSDVEIGRDSMIEPGRPDQRPDAHRRGRAREGALRDRVEP